jgi:peptidyl-prolyl cis-trans isomerase C
MKLNKLSKLLILAPLALCSAQTPAPSPQTPPPASAPKPAPSLATPGKLTLEDVPGNDPIVLIVGDDKMTKAQFERLLAALPPQARAGAQTQDGKRKIAQQLAELMALAQEARKRGLDRAPDTRDMIQFQTDNVLASTLYREISNSVRPDEAQERAYYDSHKTEFEEVKASHILIRFKGSPVALKPNEKDLTDEEALAKVQDLRKRIVGGEDFATLAKSESDDSQAAKEGGSLGTFGHGRMVPDFEQAAFKLQPGELSQPIKTKFGYHIIKVDAHVTKTFEEAKPEIERKLKPELTQKAVENLRAQASITLNESYFGK